MRTKEEIALALGGMAAMLHEMPEDADRNQRMVIHAWLSVLAWVDGMEQPLDSGMQLVWNACDHAARVGTELTQGD